MNDKKFENLRKKLDTIGCTQTMHPDSFELVQRLYNQLFHHMQQVDQLTKRIKQMKNNNHGSIDAQQHINNLITQRDLLRKQLEEAKSGSANRENDQRMRNLTMLVNNFKIKQEESTLEYQREVKKLSSQIASLQLRNQQLQKQNHQLRASASSNSNQTQRYTAELTSLVEKKGREIKQLEDANSKYRIRIQVLERNIEESKYAIKNTKEDSKFQSDKLQQVLKQELAQSQTRVRQLKTQLETTRDEVDDLRRQLRRSRQQILLLKNQQSNNRKIQNIDRVGKQKLQFMYSEAKQQLNEKIDELRFAKERFEEEEKEKVKLELKVKQLFNKTKFLTDKNSDLQTEIEHISSKSTLNIKKVRELQAINVSLEKQLKQVQSNMDYQAKERNQHETRQQTAKIQQLRKDIIIKERQVKLFEQQLKVLKEQAQQRTIERDKAQLELKKYQTIVAEGSRNLQSLQLQKQQLMKKNRQLRNGKQMLSSADSSSRSEIFVLKQKLQASQGQMQEFRSILHSQQLRNKELESQIIRLEGQVVKSEDKNKEIYEDNKIMAGQLKVYEQKKVELQQKIKLLQEKSYSEKQGSIQYKRQLDEMMLKNQDLQREVAKKEQAIRIIDAQRDELQNTLDNETEEKEKLKQQLQKMQRDIRSYGNNFEDRERVINDLERKLSRSQEAKAQIQRIHDRLVEENTLLRDKLNACDAELREVKNEINLLVLSNQQYQKDSDRGKNKVAQLDRKLKNKYREYQQQKERASAMNVLNNQLHIELEKEKNQTMRLTGILRQLQDANNDMYQVLQRKDQELAQYSRAYDQSQRQRQQHMHQINSYQKQLEHLTQDFESLQDQARRITGQKQFFKSERNWKQQVSSLAQNSKNKQEQKYCDLQYDYQQLRKVNEELKQKCRHYQNMLSQERAQNFRLSQNLGTPARTVLVESRVQSYHEGENFNNSNIYQQRSRHHSVPSVSDSISIESRQSQSIQAKESLQQIERRYMQTSLTTGRRT